MTKISIRFFNDREVRAAWDETISQWFFAAKSADPETDTSALETQIDNLVDQLYDLNAECKDL